MSRIGKLPIQIPDGVTVKLEDFLITVTGPKGELNQSLPQEVAIKLEDKVLTVNPTGETKKHRAFHGLFRSLIFNMVEGVSNGYKKTLEIQGVGYTAEIKGKNLFLNIGFSHPILFKPPETISIKAPSRTEIVVSGFDKQLVGEVSSKIRAFRPPEPYKGKGIRYKGEYVRRKVGKTAG